ncbi:hypothetical protein FRX31_020821 [Thalictrum thalictroides]|uniref:DUF4408 domain-containing protein n=1 Tax=Thalictrum thalictroides TaxID=46969 RepID=A0A7J6VZ14_THATH|nr:hypothetical protein FRX31_020821 [Thalictrum thalictroides]
MAVVASKNPIHSIFSIKNLLLSMSVIFIIALILKPYVPIVFDIIVSGVPMVWITLRSWFTPPYLYVIVNFIIIAIVASSRFQYKIDQVEKVERDVHKEVCYDISRKNSFEVIEPAEIYGYLDGKELGVKKPKELEVKTRKKLSVASMSSEFKAPVKAESELKFQGKEYIESRVLEVRTKKKLAVESLREFDQVMMKPKKYAQMEANNLVMETSTKENEDWYSGSKSTEMPERTNTIEIPIDGKNLVFDRLSPEEESPQGIIL